MGKRCTTEWWHRGPSAVLLINKWQYINQNIGPWINGQPLAQIAKRKIATKMEIIH